MFVTIEGNVRVWKQAISELPHEPIPEIRRIGIGLSIKHHDLFSRPKGYGAVLKTIFSESTWQFVRREQVFAKDAIKGSHLRTVLRRAQSEQLVRLDPGVAHGPA